MSITPSLRPEWSSPVEPIYSVKGHHKVYLVLRRHGERVRVEPTSLGETSLPHFWPVWLRQLILKHGDSKYSFAVELQGKYVVVSGSTGTYEGLKETVKQLGAQVAPAIGTPMVWHRPGPDTPKDHFNRSIWRVKPSSGLTLDKLEHLLKDAPLPARVSLYYWDEKAWEPMRTPGKDGVDVDIYPSSVPSIPVSAPKMTIYSCNTFDVRHHFGDEGYTGVLLVREPSCSLPLRELRLLLEMHLAGVKV